MSGGSGQEKTEQATPKRLEDARKKGQVAKSRELPTVLILFGALGVFYFSGIWMFETMSAAMREAFGNMGVLTLEPVSSQRFLLDVCRTIFKILSPLFVVVTVAGLASNIAQVGFMLSPEALSPKFSKLNPISGIKKLVSLKSLVELLKSILKIGVVGWVAYVMIRKEVDRVPSLIQLGIVDLLDYVMKVSLKIAFYTALVLILLSLMDYLFQQWQHHKELRMTKQEVKEEHKQREGDPLVKARIRRTQAQMARSRMMAEVPGADVVITNPTHLAIAIKFEAGKMAAPVVVAKGAGFVAQKIREIAKENSVPVIENKPLARALFKSVKLGAAIPVDLYKAVAEILAYVYRLKRMKP